MNRKLQALALGALCIAYAIKGAIAVLAPLVAKAI